MSGERHVPFREQVLAGARTLVYACGYRSVTWQDPPPSVGATASCFCGPSWLNHDTAIVRVLDGVPFDLQRMVFHEYGCGLSRW
jgi:hypothetical protein